MRKGLVEDFFKFKSDKERKKLWRYLYVIACRIVGVSLKSIGKELGITTERVRQIESKGLLVVFGTWYTKDDKMPKLERPLRDPQNILRTQTRNALLNAKIKKPEQVLKIYKKYGTEGFYRYDGIGKKGMKEIYEYLQYYYR